ncbi:MAG: tol-pal system protein YbgF [Bdellovibrionales bacterium]
MKKSGIAFLACVAFMASVPVLAADEDRPANGSATHNETRLSAAETDIRALSGRIEQIEFALRRFEQTLQKIQTDTDMRLQKIESVQAAAAAHPAPAQAAPAEPAGSLGALKVQGDKITGAVNKPEAPSLPAVPADYGLTPQEQYERAFNFLREGDFTEAEKAFKTFIEKNPKEKLLDNAKYWYGETLYVRARYDEAAIAFAEAYQQNPKGAKAPDSLLKMGMSLGALNKIKDACVTLGELKSKYPNATATIKTRAEDERAKLKCPAR